jgi:hypothetical protein
MMTYIRLKQNHQIPRYELLARLFGHPIIFCQVRDVMHGMHYWSLKVIVRNV